MARPLIGRFGHWPADGRAVAALKTIQFGMASGSHHADQVAIRVVATRAGHVHGP